MSPRSPRRRGVHFRERMRGRVYCALVPEGIYHTRYSILRCEYRPLLSFQRIHYRILTRSHTSPARVFPRSRDKKRAPGKLSLVNFDRGSARFGSHAAESS